ncbi:DNA fragmentation factor subunit beta isoform X4 [Halichoerus grypus]
MSAVFRKPKTFRLRALHSQRKFGVAGWSCQEVLQKGCRHFQLPVTGSRLCLYEDGTELTGDYFWGVPDNSELVLLTSGQTWQGYVSDISRLLSAFHKPHAGLIQAAQQLLSDEQAPLRQKLLADLLHTVSENIAAETRAEDPPWFEGLESRFRSKSGYLRYSCESRIRSYLREVNSYASVVGVEAQEEYSRIVDVMCRELRAAQYNGSYFDRGAEAGGRLCTSEGWFCCQPLRDLTRTLHEPRLSPGVSRGRSKDKRFQPDVIGRLEARGLVLLTWTPVHPNTPSIPTVTGRAGSSSARGTWTTYRDLHALQVAIPLLGIRWY